MANGRSRKLIRSILLAHPGLHLTPIVIWDRQPGPHDDRPMTPESIRQLLGQMLKSGQVCKDKDGYFLRETLPPSKLKDWDYKQTLADFKKVGELNRVKRGVHSSDLLRAANAYIKFEKERHKRAR
jgi:hypothetical protein